jgi:membrane protein
VVLRRKWTQDKLGQAAAALTFYEILALFPFLLVVVVLASLAVGPAHARELIQALGRTPTPTVTDAISARMVVLTSGPTGGLLTFGGLGAVGSATAGVVSLIAALNTAYGVAETRPRWRIYGRALVVMIGAAVLTLLAMLLAAGAPLLAARLGFPWQALLGWARLPLAGLLMMMVWATIYAVLPCRPQPLRLFTPGAVTGVVLWIGVSWGFSFYLVHFGTLGVTYGSLAGVIALFLWMWLSTLALLLGAEINALLASPSTTGRPPPKRPSTRLDAPADSRSV